MNPLLTRIWNKLKSLRVTDRRYLYKYCEQDHLRRLLHHYEIDCVFDIGANNGQYAKMLRKDARYTGLILSFEPNPVAAEKARHLAANDPLWHVEQIAISASDGLQSFHIMADSQFSSLSTPRHDETDLFSDWNKVTETIDVKTETVTTAYHRLQAKYGFKRPFLKMDTQGYDVEIVSHAGPALSEFLGLQSELAVKKLYKNSMDFKKAIEVYESLGFELSAFVPNNGGHFPELLETDCIMIRKTALHI
jgi:FkbM family methyltransferase